MKRLKILTWHIHGSYLYYLSHCNFDFYIPVSSGVSGYERLPEGFNWGNNLHEIPVFDIKKLNVDCIIFQSNWPSNKIFLEDQYKILSEKQKLLPKFYIEHDPPREHPTDTRHIVGDKNITLVHVTHFNKLMWDSGKTHVSVIEHGAVIPQGIIYKGNKKKGLVNVNNLKDRGRRLGFDIYAEIKEHVPLDLIGINSEYAGGLGSLPMTKLPEFISQYRFFFNTIRYTSLGLAVVEAMLIGLPVLGLATTELVTIIKNGFNGFIETDPKKLIPYMQRLLKDHEYAKFLGENSRKYAQERFSINRFTSDWEKLISSQVI